MKIYTYGHPVLRKTAKKLTKVNKDIEKIINEMFRTMRQNTPRGIGLAATQVGVTYSFFVYELEDDKGVVVNPEILERRKETEKEEEGCLSVPGVYGIVERPQEIVVRYMDLDGSVHEEILNGLKARVFQHEIDHLNGIIFTDYIDSIEKLEVEEGYEIPKELIERYLKK
ncbi:peptide deformylase [Caldisericum exile]|uniref:Peptide deformylase n=1 Tax=Caldisericum exile (strain DSM 21853 / NBRC 104410 / AZM16c01) TaxID=511051 RepID=A0A7U6GEN8_CALEA|nr:peptide deformylase [Caldisericum exile]BAL80981.1 peptide deformylase [Caldisericum exile AZM16c01]